MRAWRIAPLRSALLLPGLAACQAAVVSAEHQQPGDDTNWDTGAATSAAGATEATLRDGFYIGEIIAVGSSPETGYGSETCTGTVSINVAADADPEIDGVATCAFGGWLDWMGDQILELRGRSQGSDGAEGTISTSIDEQRFEDEWTGAWDGDSLSAWFAGTQTFSMGDDDFEVRFEGSFTARRQGQ